MAALDDLATAYQTLADHISGVDVDTVASGTDDLAQQAAGIGSAELNAALANVKETAEDIRRQLDQVSGLARAAGRR